MSASSHASPADRRRSASADKVARLWQTATGQEVRRFEGHKSCLWGVAVSPDGRWLLTSGGMTQRPGSTYVPAHIENGRFVPGTLKQ